MLKDRIAQGESLLFAKNRILEESRVEANIHKTNYEKMIEAIQKQREPIINKNHIIFQTFSFGEYRDRKKTIFKTCYKFLSYQSRYFVWLALFFCLTNWGFAFKM